MDEPAMMTPSDPIPALAHLLLDRIERGDQTVVLLPDGSHLVWELEAEGRDLRVDLVDDEAEDIWTTRMPTRRRVDLMSYALRELVSRAMSDSAGPASTPEPTPELEQPTR